MNFFPTELRQAIANAPWIVIVSQPTLVLKVVSHLGLGLAVVVTDQCDAWVGFYTTEKLVREVGESFRGVQLSSEAEVLRLSEECLKRQGVHDNRVDVERVSGRAKSLRLRLTTSLDLLDDHRIMLSFALDCSAVSSVVADDESGLATFSFLREVLWSPVLGLTQALGSIVSSLAASGRVTSSELDLLSRHPAIQNASRNVSPVFGEDIVEKIRANLFAVQTNNDGGQRDSGAGRGNSPRMVEAVASDAPRKRELEHNAPKLMKSAEEERMKKIRRVLK